MKIENYRYDKLLFILLSETNQANIWLNYHVNSTLLLKETVSTPSNHSVDVTVYMKKRNEKSEYCLQTVMPRVAKQRGKSTRNGRRVRYVMKKVHIVKCQC